jgi:hypothetical protein
LGIVFGSPGVALSHQAAIEARLGMGVKHRYRACRARKSLAREASQIALLIHDAAHQIGNSSLGAGFKLSAVAGAVAGFRDSLF